MSKVRIGLVALLFLAPWVFLFFVGSYHLWATGWLFWAWLPMFLSLGMSYFLASRWSRSRKLLPDTDGPAPNYWTERDKLAWEKVADKAKQYDKITTEQLADARHYSDLALDLAEQVARVYYPRGATPFEHLTIPEVLACIELAATDLDELVQKYVPASHVLRIRDFQTARKAADWYKTGQNIYWAGAMVFNPAEVAVRWLISRYAVGGLLEKLQGNLLLWFHTAFIHHLGRYLIEMNSGRLKVGVKRYREILQTHGEPPIEPVPVPGPPVEATSDATAPVPKPLAIVVLGAVKAGKSSLVNALLGQQAAMVDALPVAHVGVRYSLTLPGGQAVAILDTVGYGQDGPDEAEFLAAAEAARDADLALFVTPATSPGRANDVALLDRLKAWFAERPQLKPPPILAIANQIDLLSPKAEWSPPYDWEAGTRPKEANMRDCVAAVREQLGSRVVEVVPVCARHGETFGIAEGLVPAIASQLDDARGSAVLKAFHGDGQGDQFKKIGKQLVEGGKKALGILWENLKK